MQLLKFQKLFPFVILVEGLKHEFFFSLEGLKHEFFFSCAWTNCMVDAKSPVTDLLTLKASDFIDLSS
ncbi:hypothetical protein PanWU01x14_127510 [Parasponia andersonii]|uniref:Uncharacterized protein n=1 Tax=Parasponia andersonii TaxID=3476 RepID=A0A2P5CSE9_PARAD|nr:hypothetical protein PanWU01x14_127510 [Parasponia andersonii]